MSGKSPICSLCMKDPLGDGQEISSITCGHTFHKKWYVLQSRHSIYL